MIGQGLVGAAQGSRKAGVDAVAEPPSTSGARAERLVEAESLGPGGPPHLMVAAQGIGGSLLPILEEIWQDLTTKEDVWDPSRSPLSGGYA